MAYWVDVAARLRDEYGWDICYFIGSKQQQKVSQLFPRAVFHSKGEIRRNRVPSGCEAILPSPLDKPLLDALSGYESIFLKMMDRQNYNGALTYFERISRYHSQMMYWKSVLEHFRPDVVVYRITPHVDHDYALYSLCRVMGIRTVMIERTSLPGVVYPVNSFEEGSEIIRTAYRRALEEGNRPETQLSSETESHLEKLGKTYADAMPYYLKYKLGRYSKSGDVGGTLTILARAAKDLAKAYMNRKADADKVPGYMRKRYHTNMGGFKRKKILDTYNRMAKEVDLHAPFIFVALQCEPERQTCPSGGVFGNQYLMIDMLSKLAPQGWNIYVKEHVSQFKVYQAAERSKPVEFYDMIASMPNVRLVPLSYNSFELIDNANASATVSGTVGWESVVRGKPSLLFGHAWYRDCRGVFITHTVENCRKAIQEIGNGYRVDAGDVRCFAKVVESCSVKGYTHKNKYQKMNVTSPEENVSNLAEAIHDFVR